MPSTRRDFMTGAATATAAALGSSVLPAIPDPTTASENRFRPRLIYYNDAHHFHAKRLDPPVSVEKLGWPVDELLGTGVDLLVLGLGYGDVYFHDSKVGRVVGQEKEVWENFIDWRIMCMVRDARKLGTDQLREVIRRGREKGLKVFPSLKLQDVAQPGDERCGWLKWRQHPEVCLKEKDPKDPRSAFGYDFTHPLVREDKLKMVREVLSDYGADGIELDFMFYPAYFRRAEVDRGASLMTRFVADVREAARAVGREQKRSIPISARVFHRRDENLGIGLDVESWLKEKSVDLVVGQVSDTLFETGDRHRLAGNRRERRRRSVLPATAAQGLRRKNRFSQHRDVPRIGSKPLPTRVRRHVSGLSAMASRGERVRDPARNRVSRSVRAPGQALLPSAARAGGRIHPRALAATPGFARGGQTRARDHRGGR